jgi:signal transduction histidine kinase/DNA-binding response OmpR family regulator
MSEEPKVKILVVDDLPEKLLVYQVILEELGQELIMARSGTEALRHVLEHDFAVVLLDVNMPDVDGFETAALIRGRKRSAHTPIIFVTAFADEVRITEGYARGAVDYIQAPVVPEVLRAKVKVFVDLFRMTERVKRQAEERITLAEERTRRAAAEEANRQLEFLVEAGGVLAKSLDSQVTAENVARVVVPELADRVVIAQLESHTNVLTCIDAEGFADGLQFHNTTGLESLPAHWTVAIERVLAAGITEYLTAPDVSPSERPSTIVLPLHARGRTFGVLCFSREPSRRTFSSSELSIALALSSRSSIAMDNSRLYRDVEQADRHKNEFLSMLAHELRNPLAPIRNAVAVLRQAGDGEAIAWAEDIIDRQVTQLVRIVDDLLDLSRITQGKIRLELEKIDIASVATSAIETSRPLIDARRHQLQVQLPSEPLFVHVDQARLSQVLSNLLNNAAKYTPDQGRIWLSVSREGEQAVIRIRDTGIGIPPDLLAKVFDLFTQADTSLDRAQGGLGIGLTLVKRLVELQNGSVEVASAGSGKGSEFTVRLPVISPQPHKPARRNSSATASGEKLRIIAVDDNQDAADTLAQFLRIQGHDVRVLYEGQGVAELVGEFRPQVVILDLGLPGMSGYDVAKQLTGGATPEDLLLVALSGYGRDEDIQRSRECGFHHHFVKPLDIKAMMNLLATAPLSRT